MRESSNGPPYEGGEGGSSEDPTGLSYGSATSLQKGGNEKVQSY